MSSRGSKSVGWKRDVLVVAGNTTHAHLGPVALGALDASLGARDEVPPNVPRPDRGAADDDDARFDFGFERHVGAGAQDGESPFAVGFAADLDVPRDDVDRTLL